MSKRKPKIYLVSGMEKAVDMGAGWRKDITPFLEELGFEVLDPVLFEPRQLRYCKLNDFPDHITTLNGQKMKVTKWHDLLQVEQKTELGKRLYNRALNYMRRIVRFDCHIVNEVTDVILCYWNEATGKGAGSATELSLGFLRGIPIYCIADTRMPAWARGCCTTIDIEWEILKERLKKDYKYLKESK